MTINYDKRVMVSMDGVCPMGCAHCFTYEIPEQVENGVSRRRTVDEIVSGIRNETFDIIYISQTYENFHKEEEGVDLCKKLYNSYGKDIFIITRSCLGDDTIAELINLNRRMREEGHRLYIAVSCFADNSYGISEKIDMCPTPSERLTNLERMHEADISTLLILRPIFPDAVVSITECTGLIEKARNYIDAVVSSGLIVTDQILERLNFGKTKLVYMTDGDSNYIKNMPKENAHFLDVEKELREIQNYCKDCNIPFFRHSMPALNHIASIA